MDGEETERHRDAAAGGAELPAPALFGGESRGGGGGAEGDLESGGEGEALGDKTPSKEQTQWLMLAKAQKEKQCTELALQLAAAREEITKRDTRCVWNNGGEGGQMSPKVTTIERHPGATIA